jgi:hypothetical protein
MSLAVQGLGLSARLVVVGGSRVGWGVSWASA